jgi:RND family efflux transporter MFP subunit
VAAAEAAVRLARRDLEHTVLVAPCAGRVAQRHLQKFTEVAAGVPVIEFDGDGVPEVLAQVPEVFARTLNPGDRARVTLQGGEDRVLQASIAQISSRSEAGSGVPVILTLDHAARDLRSGLTVEVAFQQRSEDTGALVVPMVALLAGPQPNSAAVFIYDAESGSVCLRQIMLGQPLREGMTVMSGLQTGERIVVAGVPFLSNGQKVRTVSTTHSGPGVGTLMLSQQ